MSVYSFGCTCGCACMCVCRPEVNIRDLFRLLSTLYVNTVLLNQELTSLLGWLANELQASTCLSSPKDVAAFLCGCWGSELRSSGLCSRDFADIIITYSHCL